MSPPDQRAVTGKGTLVIGILCGLYALPAAAQSLPPAQAAQNAIDRSIGTSGETAPPGAGATFPAPDREINGMHMPFQLGGTVGGYYDDNIYLESNGGPKVADYIWSVSPLIAWNSAAQTGADNSVQMAYAPTFLFYQENVNDDTVDQSGNFVYNFNSGRTDLVVSESIQSVQDSNADEGGLVTATTSVTEINFTYQLTGKTSLNLSSLQTISEDDPGFRSTEWTSAAYLDYQMTGKTSIGVGALVGFADLEGPNQTFEQLNGRVSYVPTAKLSFSATAGLEFREMQGYGGADLTPEFSLSGNYQPFDGTNVMLGAYRREEYSGKFYGENYLATGVSASFSQRLLHEIYFVLSGAFENATYQDNVSDASTGQSYNYFTIRPGVSFAPTDWCQLNFFYEYRTNLAEGDLESFSDNQAGFSASFTY
jgi:hypothetical protein